MPSNQSIWLISVPGDVQSEGALSGLTTKLGSQSQSRSNVSEFSLPPFKTGTLDSLLSLSEELPKQDAYSISVVAKIVETIRNLLNDNTALMSKHLQVNELKVEDYLMNDWQWNEGRYSIQKSLPELSATLKKDMNLLDDMMRRKLNDYNIAKGSLVQMERKRTGNLATRSLADMLSEDDFKVDSEYLETLFIVVPKDSVKKWNTTYERFTPLVVPGSSNLIAADDEYSLFNVVIFRKARDDFSQKCRENRFILRDISLKDHMASKDQQELERAGITEKQLWNDLVRLSRTNFSEAFQVLVHLKGLRLFVESVLRYGLPAHYMGLMIKPDKKSKGGKSFDVLVKEFSYLAPRYNKGDKKSKGKEDDRTELPGEYQPLMDEESYDFVLSEIPWINSDYSALQT